MCQRGLLAVFWSQIHVFDGLELFFQEMRAWDRPYVAKMQKVQPPRFRQILSSNTPHLSQTVFPRFDSSILNNLSKTVPILLSKCGGAQASGWARRLQNRFSPDKMRWVDRKNHILYKIDRNNTKTLPGNDGNNVPGISYLKPRKKVFGSQAGITRHLLQGWI